MTAGIYPTARRSSSDFFILAHFYLTTARSVSDAAVQRSGKVDTGLRNYSKIFSAFSVVSGLLRMRSQRRKEGGHREPRKGCGDPGTGRTGETPSRRATGRRGVTPSSLRAKRGNPAGRKYGYRIKELRQDFFPSFFIAV